MTVKKRIFPFLTPQNVSHIKKMFSIGKFAFSHALDRAFLSEKRLSSKKIMKIGEKNNDNEQNEKPKDNRDLF